MASLVLYLPAALAAFGYLCIVGYGVVAWLPRPSISLSAAFGLLLLGLAVIHIWPSISFAAILYGLPIIAVASATLAYALGRRPDLQFRSAPPYVIVFLAAAVLFSTILTFDIDRTTLPVASIINSDIFVYSKIAHNLLYSDNPSGNVLYGFDVVRFTQTDVPAAFALLALTSAFAHAHPIDPSLALIAVVAALTVTTVTWTVRRLFNLSYFASALIAGMAFVTPIFMHTMFAYHFSQTMHGLLGLSAFGLLLTEKPTFISRLAILLAFGGGILLTYRIAVMPDMAFFLAAMLVSDLDDCRDVREFFKAAAISVATVLLAAFLIYGMAPGQFPSFRQLAYYASAPVGYSLGLVSALSLAGIPVKLGEGLTSSDQAAQILVLVLALALSATILWRRQRAFAQLMPAVLFLLLTAAYLAVWIKIGRTYQQWKFASIFPLLFSFGFLAACYSALRSSRVAAGALNVALLGMLGLNIAAGTLVWHGKILRFPADYRALTTIDGDPAVEHVVIDMGDLYAAMIGVMFINQKPLVVVDPTSFGPGKRDGATPTSWFVYRLLPATKCPVETTPLGKTFVLSRVQCSY
jgi:hypothetical protein